MDKSLGQIGYEAYAAFTGGKTFDGRPMPSWDEVVARDTVVGTKVSGAWEAAIAAGVGAERLREIEKRRITEKQAAPQKPTLGRIVLFRNDDGAERPAVVISLGELPGYVNLGVLDVDYTYEANVPFADPTLGREALSNTWLWPPRV